MTLFDFPNPTAISETRFETSTPLQRLFFLNSAFLTRLSEAAGGPAGQRGGGPGQNPPDLPHPVRPQPQPRGTAARRQVSPGKTTRAGPQYARVLLSSNEFLYVK